MYKNRTHFIQNSKDYDITLKFMFVWRSMLPENDKFQTIIGSLGKLGGSQCSKFWKIVQ